MDWWKSHIQCACQFVMQTILAQLDYACPGHLLGNAAANPVAGLSTAYSVHALPGHCKVYPSRSSCGRHQYLVHTTCTELSIACVNMLQVIK